MVALYLLFATVQLNKLTEPEGLALAATGVALEAIPQISAQGGHDLCPIGHSRARRQGIPK